MVETEDRRIEQRGNNMSREVTYIGTLKKIESDKNLNELCEQICEDNGLECEDAVEAVQYDIDEFTIINKELYKILKKEDVSEVDIYEGKENADGTVDYIVRYCNGSICFDEAIEEVIKKMKEA